MIPIFLYINESSHAGPINRNWRSSIKDGFLPSILCPINCPIHAITNIITENNLPFISSNNNFWNGTLTQDSIQKEINSIRQYNSKSQVIITFETSNSIEELNKKLNR